MTVALSIFAERLTKLGFAIVPDAVRATLSAKAGGIKPERKSFAQALTGTPLTMATDEIGDLWVVFRIVDLCSLGFTDYTTPPVRH